MALPGLRRVDHVGFTVPDLDGGPARSSSTCWAASTCTRSGPFVHDDSDWMAEHLNVHPAHRHAAQQLLPLRRPGDLRGLLLRGAGPAAPRRRATATSAAITSPSTSTTSTPPSPTCATHGVRVLGEPTASRGPTRASAGSTSSARGACSSSWSATRRRRRSIPRTRARRSRDRAGDRASRRGQRAGGRLPAPRDPRRRDRARGADPAGGGRRAARRQPAPGPRGAADAGGRGPHRARARNKGARVPSLSMHEVDVVYRMREQLEPLAIAESMPNLTPTSSALAALQERIEEPEEADADVADFLELDREFHLRSYTGCRIDQLTSTVTRLWNSTAHYRRAFVTLSGPGRLWVINAEHRLLLDADRAAATGRCRALPGRPHPPHPDRARPAPRDLRRRTLTNRRSPKEARSEALFHSGVCDHAIFRRAAELREVGAVRRPAEGGARLRRGDRLGLPPTRRGSGTGCTSTSRSRSPELASPRPAGLLGRPRPGPPRSSRRSTGRRPSARRPRRSRTARIRRSRRPRDHR